MFKRHAYFATILTFPLSSFTATIGETPDGIEANISTQAPRLSEELHGQADSGLNLQN